MSLVAFAVNNLRNLAQVTADFIPQFNLIYGPNGSGKTSLLEAIHYLGLGRSFRTRLPARIINQEAEHFSVFGRIEQAGSSFAVGIERHSNGESRMRINQANVRSVLEITKLLPLQLLNTECRLLLTGSPKLRRQFMDWGTFHVEPHFFSCWQQAARILKQRNAALRMRASPALIQLWDAELEKTAMVLSQVRKQYVARFIPIFNSLVERFFGENLLSITYKAGWNEVVSLAEVLAESLQRDLQLGYTQYGPQRADLLVRMAKTIPAHEVLSHGQQKMLVYAMRLAQGILLGTETNKQCIYLLDDLPAELDSINRQRVAEVLHEMAAQVFITGVEKAVLADLGGAANAKLFHMSEIVQRS